MSEALKAKLRAQRAEKEQNLLHEQTTHEAAKLAARELVAIGIQFDQILEKSGVSAAYLDGVFQSLGLEKAPKPVPTEQDLEQQEKLVFGKPRWLENASNYRFSLESDSSETSSTSESESESENENEAEVEVEITELQTVQESDDGMASENTPPYTLDAIDEPVSNVVVDLTVNSQESSSSESELIDLTEPMETVVEVADNDEISDVQKALEMLDPKPEEAQSVAKPSTEEMKLQIQELEKQIEDRENALKMPKRKPNVGKARVDKRTSDLLAIASKRAALMTSKSKLKVFERSAKIAQLEEMLKREKESQLQATKDALAIDQQFIELERQALLLRAAVDDNPDETNVPSAIESTVAVVTEPLAPETKEETQFRDVEFPVANNNPLCQFPSFRLCPRLNTAEMFFERFNAAFVPDLQNRVLCDKEFNDRVCKDKKCVGVHFNEFVLPKPLILRYMATRFMNKEGFREYLVEKMRSRFQSRTVVPSAEVARAIAEISHSFGASIFDVDTSKDEQ